MKAIDLIQRTKEILGFRGDFFDAVCEWYKNVSLTRRLVKLLFKEERPRARLSITINGNLLAGEAIEVPAQARAVTWVLPAGLLVSGTNEVSVMAARQAGLVALEGATAFQETGLPRQTLDLRVADPSPTPRVALALCNEARHKGQCWVLNKGGFMIFQLRLEETAPVTFSLNLPVESEDGWLDTIEDLLEEILERVQKKRQELREHRRKAERADPELDAVLRDDLQVLDGYVTLHEKQIRPALTSGDAATLEQVISRTGSPERLLRDSKPPPLPETPLPAQPWPVELQPASPPPSRQEPPRAPRPPRPPRPRSEPASRSSGFSCLGMLTVTALVLGIGGYLLWDNNPAVREQVHEWFGIGGPIVRIDAPAEGQNVAPGMALQVAVSAKDNAGVSNIAIQVAGGGEHIEAGPNPPRFDFPAGAKQTDTKVFVLNLKRDINAAANKITINVTATNSAGKSHTLARTIRVGGKEQDLVFEINPLDPAPNQNVNVTVHALNTAPGTMVAYTVKGTDNYFQSLSVPVGADGTIRFQVPGSFEGVVDDVEVRIEGSPITRKASYRF